MCRDGLIDEREVMPNRTSTKPQSVSFRLKPCEAEQLSQTAKKKNQTISQICRKKILEVIE